MVDGKLLADTVVLDVDGVLIDASHALFKTVCETSTTLRQSRGLDTTWQPSYAEFMSFKKVIGFNSDIDVTMAMVDLVMANQHHRVMDITATLATTSGGMVALGELLGTSAGLDNASVCNVFFGYYLGPEGHGGLIDKEVPLVTSDFLSRLRTAGAQHLGVVTGRDRREFEIVVERLGWNRRDLDVVVTADIVRKPDPECLRRVVAACGSHALTYVGDTRDDLELVKRYRESNGAVATQMVLIAPPDQQAWGGRHGADLVVERADMLPGVKIP